MQSLQLSRAASDVPSIHSSQDFYCAILHSIDIAHLFSIYYVSLLGHHFLYLCFASSARICIRFDFFRKKIKNQSCTV